MLEVVLHNFGLFVLSFCFLAELLQLIIQERVHFLLLFLLLPLKEMHVEILDHMFNTFIKLLIGIKGVER